jgi:hypothetical protein
MTRILAIDPGSSESGWVLLDSATGNPTEAGKDRNGDVLRWLVTQSVAADVVVIEWTSPRGMLGSLQLFETLWWAGRFTEASVVPVFRLERSRVKEHLCGKTSAKDPMITAALVDRYGGVGGRAAAVGVKACPGPLFGVKADAWAALAVACTWLDDPSLVFGYETENATRLAKTAAKRAVRVATLEKTR